MKTIKYAEKMLFRDDLQSWKRNIFKNVRVF